MAKRRIAPLQYFLYIIEFAVVYILSLPIRLLPLSAAVGFGKAVGKVLFLFGKNSLKIMEKNYQVIYGDKQPPEEEKIRTAKKLFENIARFGFEYLKIGGITAKNYNKYVVLNGLENVQEGLSRGKGVIVVTLHLGNWEILGAVPVRLGVPVGAIINRQFNPLSDAWLRNIRDKKGGVISYYNEILYMMKIIKKLRGGSLIATVCDQTYYFKPIFVPFFGKIAATADGPARLHLKYRAPIIFAYSNIREDGRYQLNYSKPVMFEPSDNMNADIEKIMTWVNQEYEKVILKYPDQWFSFLHDRWDKTKPEDFADIDDSPF